MRAATRESCLCKYFTMIYDAQKSSGEFDPISSDNLSSGVDIVLQCRFTGNSGAYALSGAAYKKRITLLIKYNAQLKVGLNDVQLSS